MSEKDNENPNDQFDENNPDPTEEAFFSDMVEMEEEIASEAYELVEHGLHLIDTQFYDDGIEILRQAIGLYSQINKEEEVKAINDKISDVYLLKEKSFREIESVPEKEVEEIQVEKEADNELKRAEQLLMKAKELVERKEFEVTLDIYDEVETIYEQLDKTNEIEKLNELIEECYDKKAEFLRTLKKEIPEKGEERVPGSEGAVKEDDLKEEKLKQFLEVKKQEDEISTKAYDLLDKATELAKNRDYEQALKLYYKGSKLFQDLNWTYEVQKIDDTIDALEKERVEYIKNIENHKIKTAQEVESQKQQEEILDQVIREREEQEKKEKLERIKEKEFLKLEEDFFKAQVNNMATEASNLAHNYEIAMKKAIKGGYIVEKCVYPEVIQIYMKIKEILIEKGWNSEAEIYENTIEIYTQKLEQDKKIRQIEAQKEKKQREAEELLTITKDDFEVITDEVVPTTIDEIARGMEIEIQNLRKNLEEMTKRAERLAREYEVALRQGRFELKCPYPEIIKIYEDALKIVVEKGLETEETIFTSQIYAYNEKWEKDKRLRQIEVGKLKKQKEAEEHLKMKKGDKQIGLDLEKLKEIEERKRKKQEEDEDFEKLIEDMIKKAEKMAHNYDIGMKKAIKEGKIADNPPFQEIIKIYERARKMAIVKGRKEDAAIYITQIQAYNDRLAKDNNLREIEEKKANRQKDIEDMHRLGKKVKTDKQRLKNIEAKKEEEEFGNIIATLVDDAEKMVRNYEIAKRKALRKGEIVEASPYLEVIEKYKDVRDKVLDRGWSEQAKIYSNQIKIYQDKLEKHKNLFEIEAQKVQRQKDIDNMHKRGKKVEIDKDNLKIVKLKKEEEEFEIYVSNLVDKAEKLNREYVLERKKALKKGELKEETPYPEIIEIYRQIRKDVSTRGWNEQAKIYSNQIKIYQDKFEKHKNLFEVEAQKVQRQKDIDDMHKRGKKVEIDKDSLKIVKLKKEEEEFEIYISNLVDKAEKLNRNYVLERKKALKKGELKEETPYPEIIEIYRQIKKDVSTRGWNEEAKIYSNQIKIYQDKFEKHKNLFEVEAQKVQRQKDIDDMHKRGKKVEIDKDNLKIVKLKKEEEEFEMHISSLVDKAEKLNYDYELQKKKAIKEGIVLEDTPYLHIIDIYKEIIKKITERGWADQVIIYRNQIKIYQEKLENIKKLSEVEKEKAKRSRDLEEMHKIKEGYKPKKVSVPEHEYTEEDKLLDEAMALINEAENTVKSYELSLKKEILQYENPYDMAITNYENAREKFQKIEWYDEAHRLVNTIKFYKDKKEKDEKLREIERKKLEEPKEIIVKTELDKSLLERQKKILEFERRKKEVDESAAQIFDFIQNAERMAQEYELKIQAGIFDYDAPYEKVIEIYKEARKQFEEIGWKEESTKLLETIKYYNEKQEQDKKIRSLEAERLKQRKQDLLFQQNLLEDARIEQEKLLKEKEETLILRKEQVVQFESHKDKAFRLMDRAKRELSNNNFEKAIELYQESEEIFIEISWKEGTKMIKDSITMIKSKHKAFELQLESTEEEKAEKLRIEKQLEEQFTKAEEIRKLQQEEKRRELQKIQREKDQEREISEEAYRILEQGTTLLEGNKFDDAYENYIKARELFNSISWKREVSRINNELLFILKRERKKFEVLEEIKKKKTEEDEKLEILKQETKKEHKELEKRKKEEKRLAAKEKIERKMTLKLEKAYKLIDEFRYNEGLLFLMEEFNRLNRLGNQDDATKINNQINNIKSEAEVSIITLEDISEGEKGDNFELAYRALDKAQISLKNNRYMKAISELNEAKYNLKELEIGKKIVNEIDIKITDLKGKLGKIPIQETPEIKDETTESESERLKARIAARRAERRKKVLDLLKKD